MCRPSATKGGASPATGGRIYLSGMSDLAVKLHGKSYDDGNSRDLAQCRHMALVGCGKSLSEFCRSLTGGRL